MNFRFSIRTLSAPPADWVAFREKLQKSNGVLFVTPRYNRSIPGVLKNAIDRRFAALRQELVLGKPLALSAIRRARWVRLAGQTLAKYLARAFPVRSRAARKI